MFVVIGKSGQLARELHAENKNGIFLGRNEIDITSFKSLSKCLDNYEPNVVINASAYTNVEKAEEEKENAFNINSKAVSNIAKYCFNKGIRLVHISTDFVFNGKKGSPYKVFDKPDPINIYGASKLKGELEIKHAMPCNYSIVRTSWVYSKFGENFVKKIIELMEKRSEIRVISNQFGSPTYAKDLAKFIIKVSNSEKIKPIYHWSDVGEVSWFDFATEIYAKSIDIGLITNATKIIPINSSSFNTKAKRPAYSVLHSDEEDRHHWKENLSQMLKDLKKCKKNTHKNL
tara:strand:+ start:11193 stop:12056 length:864 start_codon:yes stop_codon:yes gene_type:complete